MKKWIIENTDALSSVAADFLSYVGDKRVFALRGAMGVGKTTFVKAIAEVKQIVDDVNSPTFAIVNEYQSSEGETIYHFDFYRVNNETEALDIGCDEYFYSGNYCFIEWAEKIEELLPADTIECNFTELPDGRRELVVDL